MAAFEIGSSNQRKQIPLSQLFRRLRHVRVVQSLRFGRFSPACFLESSSQVRSSPQSLFRRDIFGLGLLARRRWRIERALNPGEAWQTLCTHDRETSEALTRSLADLANATKRLSELDAQLTTAQDELGKLPPHSVRGVRIKAGLGSRYAGGTIYIGVSQVYENLHECFVNANSDRVDKLSQYLKTGEAITLTSSRGKYRAALTGVDTEYCTFDIVKD